MPDDAEMLTELATEVLQKCDKRGVVIAAAESCTGGLLSSLLTDIEGLSSCFERGFIVYSNEAKSELLGVDPVAIERHGAVSRETALAMAEGALERSRAGVAVSITGFAGPGRPGDEEGLVHLAVRAEEERTATRECHFGAAGRERIRLLAARAALEMLNEALDVAKSG